MWIRDDPPWICPSTQDIALLVDATPDNLASVHAALCELPDGAAQELTIACFTEYAMVRIADEFVVDIMLNTADRSYTEASDAIEIHEYRGLRIPIASKELMIRLKRTLRQKDALDLAFLLSFHDQERGDPSA